MVELKSLASSTSKQISKLQTMLDDAESQIESTNIKVQATIQDVKDAEEKHYRPFRAKTGLKDFRAYGEAMGKARETYLKKRRTIREHLEKLKAKNNYEIERDFEVPIAKKEKIFQDRKVKFKHAKIVEAKLMKDVEEAKVKLAKVRSDLGDAQEEEIEHEGKVRLFQNEYQEIQVEQKRVNKDITTEESILEQLRAKLNEILQKSRVEETELPLIEDENEDQEERNQNKRSSSSKKKSINSDHGNYEEQGGSLESKVPHFSQPNDTRVAKDRNEVENIDFDKLPPKLKQRMTEHEEKKIREDFEYNMLSLSSKIEGMAPNMRAGEALKCVTERLDECKENFNKAKEESRNAAAHFQRVKNTRAKCFNDAFNHIDQALKTIYTDMTKSSKHPLGGNAYLSLDDSDEPFAGGVKFNAMPPMKRFRDMEQLSGGEKTVAALALLFAIHSFRPSPFFIMDEVDAALDNINVLKVCNYIRQRSDDFQCIVISLKDMFYERSQSLVGICRDVKTNSSRTLTLDLNKFDKNDNIMIKTDQRNKRRRETNYVSSVTRQ